MRASSWRNRAIATLTAGLLVTGAYLAIGAPAAGAAGSNKITVKAGEYTYEFSGTPKAGWTEVNFVNDGTEYHMMGLTQLKKGVTVKQLKAALTSDDPNAGNDLVVGDGEVAPQPTFLGPKQSMAMLLKLPAGHYGVLCFITAPDGESHVEHGMVKTFDVASGKSSLKPPKDGVIDVTLTDTSVTVPNDSLPRKSNIKVTNEGTYPRDWNIAKLQPGVTIDQANAYFGQLFSGTPPKGAPPAVIAGGAHAIPPNGSVYLLADFSAGNYGYGNSRADVDDQDPNEVFGEFTVK